MITRSPTDVFRARAKDEGSDFSDTIAKSRIESLLKDYKPNFEIRDSDLVNLCAIVSTHHLSTSTTCDLLMLPTKQLLQAYAQGMLDLGAKRETRESRIYDLIRQAEAESEKNLLNDYIVNRNPYSGDILEKTRKRYQRKIKIDMSYNLAAVFAAFKQRMSEDAYYEAVSELQELDPGDAIKLLDAASQIAFGEEA
jgi:predicted PolB exonuclease-like 3'-5' exonuclease